VTCEYLVAFGKCGEMGLGAAREVLTATAGVEGVLAAVGVGPAVAVGVSASRTRAGDRGIRRGFRKAKWCPAEDMASIYFLTVVASAYPSGVMTIGLGVALHGDLLYYYIIYSLEGVTDVLSILQPWWVPVSQLVVFGIAFAIIVDYLVPDDRETFERLYTDGVDIRELLP